MGHIEFVGGKPIKVEQVDITDRDINKIYKELGLNTPVQPRYRSIKRQSKAKDPYVRTIPPHGYARLLGYLARLYTWG